MNIDNTIALRNTQSQLDPSKINKLDKKSAHYEEKLKEQTDAFEAIFVKQMLDLSMKAQSGLMPKGAGSEIYASMYTDALSRSMGGNMGLSDMLYQNLRESFK